MIEKQLGKGTPYEWLCTKQYSNGSQIKINHFTGNFCLYSSIFFIFIGRSIIHVLFSQLFIYLKEILYILLIYSIIYNIQYIIYNI